MTRAAPLKFADPDRTATGATRASVPLTRLETLWINTGTLCNITCAGCYIESSPVNDRLTYISVAEARPYLAQARDAGTTEIGFTGGEPFMNPDIIPMLSEALAADFAVLVLTNAMQPMHRPAMLTGLRGLVGNHGRRLTLRVSLDHWSQAKHDTLRGAGSFEKSLAGLALLQAMGARVALAGRVCWGESEGSTRDGYRQLIGAQGLDIDTRDPKALVLLPEMDATTEVPEITTACWGLLHKSPADVMCARSRMVVKRKGAMAPVVLPCTLLPYEARFEMGESLNAAASADGGMFTKGAVKLCHPYCAKFCVLGGGSCS